MLVPSFHDPMKSVAVLPQTVVVPAGIPSRCPGTVPARLLRIWRLGMTVKGKKHSDESKLKMSAAKKGKRHPNSGKKLSDETKLKMSARETKIVFVLSYIVLSAGNCRPFPRRAD